MQRKSGTQYDIFGTSRVSPCQSGGLLLFRHVGLGGGGDAAVVFVPILSEALERFPARESGYPRLPQAMAAAEREMIRVKRKNKHQMPVSMGVA
jgi:hypothetical protein